MFKPIFLAVLAFSCAGCSTMKSAQLSGSSPAVAALATPQGPIISAHASWYKHGARTANGERFVPSGMTAAHRSLPFGTMLEVTNPATGKAVTVRINDRGPFIAGRDLDLAEGAARRLDIVNAGVAQVTYRIIPK